MVDAQRRCAVVPTPRGVASQFAASRSRTEALCSGADTAGGWHHSSQRAVVAQRRCAVVPTPRGGGTTARSEPQSHRGAVQWCRHRGGVAPQLAASRGRTEALCSGADTAGGWHHSLQRAVVAQRRRRVARGRENSLLLCG